MRYEDILLYLCCTQDLPEKRLERLITIARTATLDWGNLFLLAHEHGVAPLVFQNLERAKVTGVMPAAIIQRFKLATYQNVLAKQKQADRLVEALAYLQSREIDSMLVKGVALDIMVYEQPWYTVAQDIDLVLRPRGSETQPRAWQTSQRELAETFHEWGIEFERDSHHDVTLNDALSIDFDQLWSDATLCNFGGYPVFLMAPEAMLLAICINSCRKRYFRLRSLCDIAETVKRFPHMDWAMFAKKAIAYGCNNIVYTALSVAAATVTVPVPGPVMESLAVGALRRQAIHKAIRYLVAQVPLPSLSYYSGSKVVGRKFGWSLLLPYLTYSWPQVSSKVHEAVTSYTGSSSYLGRVA
jgi:hypothetical protein